jgi:tRNA modification GTPase
MAQNDTIVATATAPGDAAIAITRLTGPDAVALAARHFRGARSPLDTPSHRILFGTFIAGGAALDTVLLSIFRAPRSYTGEDVVEISSHGGHAVPRSVLEALLASGARAARPGEFTERAFRNGKIDLAQAESVASVIRARSDHAARAAGATLGGELTRRIDALDSDLVTLLAEVESRIDFPGDVREAADVRALADRCGTLAATLRDWIDRLPSARRREGGVRAVILGAPNVGKSSLLNALLGFDRAIVNEAPGTTRDTVEASIWLDRNELRLIDTAGIRAAADPVERLGVERTERAAAGADLFIVVLDCTRPAERLAVGGNGSESAPVIVVWNKSDLAAPGATFDPSAVGPGPGAPSPSPPRLAATVETVAVRAGGVDPLIAALRAALPRLVGETISDELPTTSARQEALLVSAHKAMERARAQLLSGSPIGVGVGAPDIDPAGVAYDLAAVDLTEARQALGEIVGRGVDDSVVAAIFQRFCIGK